MHQMLRVRDHLARPPVPMQDRLVLRVDHSARPPAPMEDRLALRADHSAHLRVSPVAALAAAVFPVAIRLEVFLVGIPLEGFLVAIPSVAASLAAAEAA